MFSCHAKTESPEGRLTVLKTLQRLHKLRLFAVMSTKH